MYTESKDLNYPFNLLETILGDADDMESFPSDFQPSVEYALSFFLTEREAEIIHMRYKYGMDYVNIGKEFGVTRERIRQIEKKAITKLGYPSHIKWLTIGVSGIISENAIKAKETAVNQNVLLAIENITSIRDDLYKIINSDEIVKKIDEYEPVNLDKPINIDDLSVRSYNCLFRANIRTLRNLTETTTGQLMELRNLGKRSLDEVIDYIHSNGLKLKDE